jgi:hypothetical protein
VLGRGCYYIWGASYVPWVFVGGFPFFGFFWVSCGFGVFLLLLWCLLGLTFVFLGFWGFSLSFGFPLFLWASWVVPLYTSCVLRALYAFFNEIFLLIKKKKKS